MRTRFLLVVPLALLTACSSGGSTSSKGALEPSPVSSVVTAPPVGSARATTSPSAAAHTPTGAGSSPTSAAAAPSATSAPGRAPASKATPAGRYTYASSGTVTFGATTQDAAGSQTLTISPLRAGRQHSTLHSDDSGDTEQDLVVRDSGSYGASLKLTSPAFTKEFRPVTPVLLVPDPAVPGRSWSWSATSTDGATHLSTTNRLLRKESLAIGGSRVDTVVLQTHLVLTGDVRYDAQLTVWWAPAGRLPVKTHTVGSGSYSGIPFKTDITAVLRSVRPS